MKLFYILLAVLFSTAVHAKPTIYPTCSWNNPGHDPYMGDIPAAVDDYTEIPEPIRERLKQRMRELKYDDLVVITRDWIEGNAKYQPEITDMHFGVTARPKMCRTVKRDKWKDTEKQRGLVYCEDHYCILIPTICRNVSRILPKVVANSDDEQVTPEIFNDPRPFIPPSILGEFPADPAIQTDETSKRNELPGSPNNGWLNFPRPGYGDIPRDPPADLTPPDLPPTPVDEPSTVWLLVVGAVALMLLNRCTSTTFTSSPK